VTVKIVKFKVDIDQRAAYDMKDQSEGDHTGDGVNDDPCYFNPFFICDTLSKDILSQSLVLLVKVAESEHPKQLKNSHLREFVVFREKRH
jgi:hypothetical protein